MLRRYANSLLRGNIDRADVFHDALMVILCHPRGPDDARWFAPWCRGVVRHVAVRSYRARRRADLLVCVGNEMDELPEDDTDWEVHAATRDLVTRGLEQLDPEARELLHRRYWLGENSGEIASDSPQSAAGIRMRIKRLLDSFSEEEESIWGTSERAEDGFAPQSGCRPKSDPANSTPEPHTDAGSSPTNKTRASS